MTDSASETGTAQPDRVGESRHAPEIDKLAFESKAPDRGYTVRASYLKEPKGEALVEIFKNGAPLRSFLFPAYKIWNIAAHFSDIVDGEIENSARGYEMAAWNGLPRTSAPHESDNPESVGEE